MTKELILTICFSSLVFEFLIWFITDPRPRNQRIKESLASKRIPVYIKASFFITIYLLSSYYLTWPSTNKNETLITIGLIIFFLGMFFAIWAKLTMNKNWGLPAQHDNKRQSELVTHGPFSYSRNPIYLGNMLLAVGFSIALRSYSIFLIPLAFYFVYKTVLIEEGFLHKKFGTKFDTYKKKVPRFI